MGGLANWTTPEQRETLRAQGWELAISEEFEQWEYDGGFAKHGDAKTSLQVDQGPVVTWVQGSEVWAILKACALLSATQADH